MAKILWIFLLVFFFAFPLFAQVNEYLLDPVDLEISPNDSTVQINININTIEDVQAFMVGFYTEGTSNPVLDTVLTGGLADTNPPAFAPPSLVSWFTSRIVSPYGPPVDPLLFVAVSFGAPLPPSSGLYCRMFYKVSGPGTLTFRTAVHSCCGSVCIIRPSTFSAPINWSQAGEVGSFDLLFRGDANRDTNVTVTDVVYLINYLFKNGPPPIPILEVGDVNCDSYVTVSDVIYLINYLFKGGPLPCD